MLNNRQFNSKAIKLQEQNVNFETEHSLDYPHISTFRSKSMLFQIRETAVYISPFPLLGEKLDDKLVFSVLCTQYPCQSVGGENINLLPGMNINIRVIKDAG